MKKDILLTISILVAGKKKEVWKCLDSLKHLRETVSCELIITDTGCSADVRERLEEYADIMLDFEWCDDFSAARNAGLDISRGRWFLYIDDDEWFENTAGIERFFKTGEYKKYANAMYIQRNYIDLDGRRYEDSYVSRMFAINPGVRFLGRIHEYAAPLDGYTASVPDVAHHYGYIFTDRKEELKHIERNKSLLVKMMEAEPCNPRWGMHLAQELYVARDWDGLYKLGEDGIALLREGGDDSSGRKAGISACEAENPRRETGFEWDTLRTNALGTFYASKIISLYMKGDYEGVYNAALSAVEDDENSRTTKAYASFFAAEMSLRYGNQAGLIRHISDYWDNYEWLKKHENDRISQSTTNFVRNYGEPKRFFNAACYAVCAGIAAELDSQEMSASENKTSAQEGSAGKKDGDALIDGRDMAIKYALLMNTDNPRVYLPDGVICVFVYGLERLDDEQVRWALFDKLYKNERLRGNMYDEMIRSEALHPREGGSTIYGYLLGMLEASNRKAARGKDKRDELFLERARSLEALVLKDAKCEGGDEPGVGEELMRFALTNIDYYKYIKEIPGDIPEGSSLPRDVAAAVLIKFVLERAADHPPVEEVFPMIKQIVEIYPILAESLKKWISEYLLNEGGAL